LNPIPIGTRVAAIRRFFAFDGTVVLPGDQGEVTWSHEEVLHVLLDGDDEEIIVRPDDFTPVRERS
jgi:hypothetical protein